MVYMSGDYPKQERGLMTYPGTGWRRALYRAPILLWRLGLGPLVGEALLLITHTGRQSGLPRRTVVEYQRLDGIKIAPCAFGPRAEWYRNLQADPFVTVQSSEGAESMRARRVTDVEELLAAYAVFRGRGAFMLARYLESIGVPNTAEDVLRCKDRVCFIAFEPTDTVTPPPQAADLTRVWWVMLAIHLALRLWGWKRHRQTSRA